MLPAPEVHARFRFGFLSEVIVHPYSISVGSIYKTSKEFSKEILQLIEKIPCTVTDPFNLPFRIAVNLIQNSYCKELPSLSESAAIITQGYLEYCLKSLDSLLLILEKIFQALDQKIKESDLLENNNELTDNKVKEINKQIMSSLVQMIGNVEKGNLKSIDINTFYSFLQLVFHFIQLFIHQKLHFHLKKFKNYFHTF